MDQIEVKPLAEVSAVFEAMTKPLEFVRERGLAPTVSTASDVRALTRGHPFEVNLVCHFIWEAVRSGEQPGFELSPSVIERLLAELEEKGRRESSSAISLLSDLTSSEDEILDRVTPHEALTVHQTALIRLMLRDFNDADLAETEEAIRADLRALEARGVLSIEADRFSLRGGSDARLYAKYASRRRNSGATSHSMTYARKATLTCGDKLGEALVGIEYPDALIVGGGVPHEVGGVQAGRWLNELCNAAQSGDLPTLAQLLRFPFSLGRYAPHKAAGLLVCGLVLQIGVDEAEHVELIANVAHLGADEAEEAGRRWIDDNRDLLGKYDIRVLDHRVYLLAPDISRDLLAYSQLQVMGQVAFVLYGSGLVQDARAALAECVADLEALLDGNITDPLVRTQFADALSRLAFMAATLSELDEARDLLERADHLALDTHWLRHFNGAYVAARKGRMADAARLGALAAGGVSDRDGLVVLHADFGEPPEFVPDEPRWNVVELRGSWIQRFVELQVAVWRARSGEEGVEELFGMVKALSRSTPVPLLRLAAWAELLIGGRRDTASDLFARAVEAADLEDVAAVRRECERALALGAG
jgi:hypothetical protein